MKKESNPKPSNAVKPPYTATAPATITLGQEQMAAVFNEWAKRYAEDPDSFSKMLDASGNPIADYGERCARYFSELYVEMGAK